MEIDVAILKLEPRPAAYVLGSVDGKYLYKGSARKLSERLKDHRAGRVSHTKNRRPLVLFYYEYFPDYSAARKQELFLKTGQGRLWLEARIKAGADGSAGG